MSCGAVRAYNDTMHKVYAANPNTKDYMKVNPMHSSMKMVQNTVEVLESWFSGEDAGDVISVGTSGNSNTIQVRIMGLKMILCPGVQNFEVADVPDDQIANDIKSFITATEGDTVAELSFYHHRATGMDGDRALLTERMTQWSEAVTTVTSWTKDDGSNACLDKIINENMDFTVNNQTMDVKGKISNKEAKDLATSLGFEEDDLETCIWYMTYGLGVSPQICSVQPQTDVMTLCKDGTSDLSKCPPPENKGSWINSSIGVMTLLVSAVGAVMAL